MTAKLAITCCAVGLVVGVAATCLLRPADTAPQPRAEAGDLRRSAVIERTGPRTNELRQLIATEVRTALRDHAEAEAPAAEPAAPAAIQPVAPEPTAAFAPARAHLAQRIAYGTWTADDRDWMHGTLGAVNHAERRDLIKQLIVAANTGKVRVATNGPLF